MRAGSSGSRVRTWPRPDEVVPALATWAEALLAADPRVVGVRLFGSYALGNWGVGSDADVLVELSECADGVLDRIVRPDPPALVPVDVVIRTTAELDEMRRQGYRFARMLDDEGVWLARRAGSR